MRGEKACKARSKLVKIGSPPLARGKAENTVFEENEAGITPACAGKSFGEAKGPQWHEDHPRLRGEKTQDLSYVPPWRGSPPLARGKAEDVPAAANGNGITPACAGKSHSHPVRRRDHRDHPRLRGEKMTDIQIFKNEQGSPPLARGKDSANFLRMWYTGITPACAGKSRYAYRAGRSLKDHPRLRGEKNFQLFNEFST